MKILPIRLRDKLIRHQEEEITASGRGQNEQNADMAWGLLGAPEMSWSVGFLEGACQHLRTVSSQAVTVTHLGFSWVAFYSFFHDLQTCLMTGQADLSAQVTLAMVQTRKCVEDSVWVHFIHQGHALAYITLHGTWSFLWIALSGGFFLNKEFRIFINPGRMFWTELTSFSVTHAPIHSCSHVCAHYKRPFAVCVHVCGRYCIFLLPLFHVFFAADVICHCWLVFVTSNLLLPS